MSQTDQERKKEASLPGKMDFQDVKPSHSESGAASGETQSEETDGILSDGESIDRFESLKMKILALESELAGTEEILKGQATKQTSRKPVNLFFLHPTKDGEKGVQPSPQEHPAEVKKPREEKKPTRFGYLVSSGLITQVAVDEAVREAKERQRDAESILMEKHKISKKEIGQSLSRFYKCPFMEFDDRSVINLDLVENISLNYLKANYWIPLARTDTTVEILIDDPYAYHKVRDIKHLFPLKEIKFHVGLRDDIMKFINSVTGPLDPAAHSIASILGELVTEEEQERTRESDLVIDENDSAIIRLANQIVIDAYKAGASDIHIEPYDKDETVVRFRVDGVCREYLKLPASYRRALSSRIKVMADLDIAERRKPQDGKIKFRLPHRLIEVRVVTIPTQGLENEDVVMRILPASGPLSLDQLRMSERNLKEFRGVLDKPYGIILCVGPTGSGKTTTLHSALANLNDPETKIWTAEDPVEITQKGLRQVQVHPKIGFDFAAALRAFLRADPDVIMIGEMRDKETCEIAIEASLTGHLVLSTLHTNSAVETVARLLEMGMDPFNFSDALLGVLAQRLARTICKDCKEKYHPPKDDYDLLAHHYGEEAFHKLGILYDDRFFLYKGKGCEACDSTGYKGRIGLHELLVATDEIKKLVRARATAAELLPAAVAEGMTTLLQDGISKSMQGWTDIKQVKAVALK